MKLRFFIPVLVAFFSFSVYADHVSGELHSSSEYGDGPASQDKMVSQSEHSGAMDTAMKKKPSNHHHHHHGKRMKKSSVPSQESNSSGSQQMKEYPANG